MANLVEMPKLGFDMAEGTLVRWAAAENDRVEKGQVLAEIETDKATVEVESPFSGLVFKHLVEENTIVPVGTAIAVIAEPDESVDLDEFLSGAQVAEPKTAQTPSEEAVDTEEDGTPGVPKTDETQEPDFIKASPIAKIIAKEKGVNLAAIQGSGPGGRFVRRDVDTALKENPAPSLPARQIAVQPGKDETLTISRLRSTIGKRMLESRQGIPHFYITRSYDVGRLMQVRSDLNDDLAEDERLSVNDLIIRAAALTLRDFPNLNASLQGNQLTRHGNINIGSAVAVEDGLLTIVVKNADQKSLMEIGAEMKTMLQRVRDGKPRSEDLEGSTFTISNLGMYSVDDFVAIINPPEAAILAVSSAMQVPVAAEGHVSVGWRMKATISADHRITDGAEAAQFMARLADFLEKPWRLV